MTQQEFVLADWIGRLRDSLQALVTYEQETEWALSDLLWRGEQTLGLSGSTHENSTMNIRERVDRYAFVVRDQSRNDSPYQQKVSTLLNQIEQVMLEHPVISQAVYSSKDRSVVDIDLATMRIPGQPVDRMVQGLVDYAFEHSAEAAAEAYAQMIQCGERRELIVDSLMLFRGLHVGERLDITPDMSVISWHEVQRYLSRWSVQSLLDPITGKPREPIGAVVSSVNTGPIILRESRRPEEGWPDRQPSFREQSLMIIDLLAVTHTSTVHTTGRTTSDVDQQFARLTGVSPTFRRSVTGERDNVSELTEAF